MNEKVDVRLIQKQLSELKQENDTFRKGAHTGGGNPPGGSGMEKRVEKLELAMPDIQLRLIRIESRLDHMVSKADLLEMSVSFHKSLNEQTWKFLAGATSMSALFASIAFGLAKMLN
ncbi:MAG: hypothetical protein Q8R10_19470 [Pseudomonas sp.]|uniref:hypothetical protein n=1 Tax=Pseudomonas sp. TaxID=306 RepID=UPI0027339D31|nr:hypothetical protein [Pseudomonas sp.]MDP3848604.1 hypothetical protein [Pseudomonas sp.]